MVGNHGKDHEETSRAGRVDRGARAAPATIFQLAPPALSGGIVLGDEDQARRRVAWLQRFRAGDRSLLAEIYRQQFGVINRAAAVLHDQADREDIIQRVFFRLLSEPAMRAAYRGGDMGVWLAVIARNQAIDHLRRQRRETPSGMVPEATASSLSDFHARTEARLLIERFRKDIIPARWLAVFEARYLQQLSQAEAAVELGMARTTLAYQEAGVRRLLRRFLRETPPLVDPSRFPKRP